MINRLLHSKYLWVILLLIGITWTFLLYFRVISFEFINWDDNAYIYQNKDIKELTISSVSKLFSSFYLGMYQPLTMLSFSLEYSFFGLNPSIFHADNLILHLFNVCLVFIFIRNLTRNSLSSFIVSLFFGIHPLHVESVAWISERKDVLYTFFYLLGLISYIQYLKVKETKFWILSIILFLLSLLSKSAAVTFPLVLMLLHFYHERVEFNLKNTLLKVWPFFILSVLFGLISLFSQKSFTTPDISQFNYNQSDRIFIAGFTYLSYIIHLVYPAVFSAIHPLPKQSGNILPIIYYLYSAITLIIFYLVYYFYKRGLKNQLYYDILFGFLFFTLTIFLILYNPASNAVYADRYTYLPYIGLFFILSGLINLFFDRSGILKSYLRIISFCFILMLGILYSFNTYLFVTNWKSSLSLWDKTTSNEPSALSYFNLAIVKTDIRDINGAINDYQSSISFNNHYYQSYINKAVLLIAEKEYHKAIDDLNKARRINHHNAWIYYNLAYVYYKEQEYIPANENIMRALKIEPDYPEALSLKALISIERSDYSAALIYLNKALEINPSYSEAYYNRGLVYNKLNKIPESIIEFTSALKMNSNYGLAFYSRANAYASLNRFDEALRDVNRSLNFDPADYMALTLRGYLLYKSDHFKDAMKDLNKAIKLKPDYMLAYNNRALIYKSMHHYDNALMDLNYVVMKEPGFVNAIFNRAEIYLELNQINKACIDLHIAYKGGIAKAGLLIDKNCR